jgi:hypothetical protein
MSTRGAWLTDVLGCIPGHPTKRILDILSGTGA